MKYFLRPIVSFTLLFTFLFKGYSQTDSFFSADSLLAETSSSDNLHKFKPAQIIVPVALIGAGITGLESEWVKKKNSVIRNALKVDNQIKADNYLPYVPMVGFYALNLCNVKSNHNIAQGTFLLATSYIIVSGVAGGTKALINCERPDKSDLNSFPSGHTSKAFMAAEFLRKEYSEYPLIGITAYTIATATGVLRICNDKHWATDVLAGAGVGILSTNAAYWLYPHIQKILFNKGKMKDIMAMPYYNSNSFGLSLQVSI